MRQLIVAAAMSLVTLACAAVLAASQTPDVDAQATFTRICVKCHTPDRIVNDRRTRDQWQEEIDKMVAKGATGTDDELATVLDYLLRHHGRVDMNRAAAGDMCLILSVPASQADAIVAYRKEHGKFEDFDALSKVPGIDVDKLSRERDAMSF
jgi:competence protein ComEA